MKKRITVFCLMLSVFYITAQTTPGLYSIKNLDINTKESDLLDLPVLTNTGIFISFWKKGYCHIDGKVYTINFCPGSEIVCPTFSDFKINR